MKESTVQSPTFQYEYAIVASPAPRLRGRETAATALGVGRETGSKKTRGAACVYVYSKSTWFCCCGFGLKLRGLISRIRE